MTELVQRLAEPAVEYLTRPDGQRTGVILRWEDYQTLRAYVPADLDVLMNLSKPELQALAEGMLSSPHQQRLSELLQRNRVGSLNHAEEAEMDHLLEHVDYMNILKARALYTLQKLTEKQGAYA
jgi:hypothetical protein